MRYHAKFPIWGALFLLLFFAAPAFGRSDLTLYPVRIVGIQDSSWQVAVNVPCGGRLLGLVVNEVDERTVELAAAIKRERVTCTGWGSLEVKDVAYVSLDRVVRSMSVLEYTTRLSISEIEDVRRRPDGDRLQKLFGIYHHPCKARLGTLVREQDGRLELALVHERDAPKTSDCRIQEKVVALAGLTVDAATRAVPMVRRTDDVARQYRLRLAPVREGSIQMNALTGLSLRYERRCNEAPVGVVLGSPALAEDGKTHKLAVGMLVAQYYNFACDDSQRQTALALNEDLAIPAGWTFEPMTASVEARDRLDLRLPETVGARSPNGATDTDSSLVLKYARGCGKTLGSVYSHDATGRLVVGVVERKTGKCGGSLKGTLKQPFLARDASTVLPLRVRGG